MRLKCDKFRVQKLRLIRWGQKLAGPKISCSLYHSRVFFSWHSRALLLTVSDYLDRHISTLDLDDICGHSTQADTQGDFDVFYNVAPQLLERFYPLRTITITSRDPYYITAAIKVAAKESTNASRAYRGSGCPGPENWKRHCPTQ